MKKRICLLICGVAGVGGLAGLAAAAVLPPADPVTCPDCSPLVYLQGIEVPVCSPLGTVAFAPTPPIIPANPAQHPAEARLPAYGAMLAGMQIAFSLPAYAGLSAAVPDAGPNGEYAALGGAAASAPGGGPEYAALPVSAPRQAARVDYAAQSLHAMTLGAPPTYGVAQPHTPAFAIERRSGLASGASLGRSGPDWFALSGQTPVTAGAGATRKPVTYSTGLSAVDPFIGCESAEPWAYSVAGMYANLARAAKARGDQEAYVKLVNQYLQMVEQGELRKTMAPRRR